jgi:hypothetical protein
MQGTQSVLGCLRRVVRWVVTDVSRHLVPSSSGSSGPRRIPQRKDGTLLYSVGGKAKSGWPANVGGSYIENCWQTVSPEGANDVKMYYQIPSAGLKFPHGPCLHYTSRMANKCYSRIITPRSAGRMRPTTHSHFQPYSTQRRPAPSQSHTCLSYCY